MLGAYSDADGATRLEIPVAVVPSEILVVPIVTDELAR